MVRNIITRPIRARWWILFTATVVAIRVGAVLAAFPDQEIVPDETLYAFLLTSFLAGEDMGWATYYIGFGPTLVTGSLILLGQAYPFAILGLEPLEALRLASISLDLGTKLLVLHIVVTSRRTHVPRAETSGIPLGSGPGIALLVLILTPSVQLWTSLGLRDASAIFSMVVAAWGFSQLIMARDLRHSSVAAVALACGIVGLHLSRSHVVLPLVAASALALVWIPVRQRSQAIALGFVALAFGSFLGSTIRENGPQQPTTPQPRIEYLTPTPEESAPATPVEGAGQKTPPDLNEIIIPGPPPYQVGRNLFVTRENLRADAESAYKTNYCESAWSQLSTAALCELRNLPTGIHRFLLSPNLLESGVNIPPSRLLAGMENVVWLVIFASALITVLARKSVSWRLSLFVATFLVLTTVAYALVSGNEGTAFRHKGQFLWAWCLVIALGYGWRPWVRSLVQRKQPVS